MSSRPNAVATHGNLIERFLLLWLLLICLIAFRWPAAAGFDPFLATRREWLDAMFAVTMFMIGWLLPIDEIHQVARNWPKVVGGTCIQYSAMPLLALSWASAFGLREELFWGVMVVGCVPGAMASNVLTLVARGNVSYSLCLTATATMVSPLLVPVILKVAIGQQHDIDAWHTSWRLCYMVVLPTIAGHLTSRLRPDWQPVGKRVGPVVANLTILWIIAVVVAKNRANLSGVSDDAAGINGKLIAVLLVVNLSGYVVGFLGGSALRLDSSMRRALVLEIGMQNAGLGAQLAAGLFADRPLAALPAALYTFGSMFTGTVLARIWASRSEPQKASLSSS